MKARGGGSVVNISSVAGYYHWDGQMLYDLPKWAIFKLTHDCGKEWAPDNIRVNAVAPGWVQTDMAADSIVRMREEGRAPNLLDRVADPSEIAELVAYLVSEPARFITAEVIRIDGGGRPGWL
jgi:NAD(P)-dependent dehydrogenase (short-subunit alcohol dehydrogenase family)